MKPIKRALNKHLNSTPADSAVTTASTVLSAEVTTAAESSVAITEDEMFDKEQSALVVLAVLLAPAVTSATSAMGISTAGPAEPAKAPDPGRNVPASHRGGTVRPAPKSPAACDGRSLGDPTYTAPSRQEKIKLGSNEETQSNGRTMATHPPSVQAHTMNLHVPTSGEDKARSHGSFGRGNPNDNDSRAMSRALYRATLEATLEAKLRAAEASRRGLQDARARRQGLRDGQGEASRASAEADRLYSKVTAHLELHLEQHPQLKIEAQRKAKAEAKAKAKAEAKAEAKVAAGSARQSVSESSDDELPVARAVEWPEATPTVLALSRRSESSKSSPCHDTCMAKTGVGCEWVAMYQDRAEQTDGAPRAVAGLATGDNRAKAHGEVAWSGPVREEAMRFHNKFVNLHDDAEGRSSFNPIAHVEVSGNQSLEVRRRVLREEERYAVREHQEPERHAAQPSAWTPKKAKPEQLAHSRSAPVESVQRGSPVASTAKKAVGEPMHQSHGTRGGVRGGVAGPHYYTSHHALDNRLMPQRMPVVGYAGHLRRTKESSDYFGTSKWRAPFSPPSRAQL